MSHSVHIFLISGGTDESVHEHMATLSARSTFPALRGFVFLDSRFSDLPLDINFKPFCIKFEVSINQSVKRVRRFFPPGSKKKPSLYR